MNILNCILQQYSKAKIWTLTLNIKNALQVIKSLKCDNIINLCLCFINRNKIAELYVPSTFQTSDIELQCKKLKIDIHLTKSPKRDHVYKLCLYMLEEYNC